MATTQMQNSGKIRSEGRSRSVSVSRPFAVPNSCSRAGTADLLAATKFARAHNLGLQVERLEPNLGRPFYWRFVPRSAGTQGTTQPARVTPFQIRSNA